MVGHFYQASKPHNSRRANANFNWYALQPKNKYIFPKCLESWPDCILKISGIQAREKEQIQLRAHDCIEKWWTIRNVPERRLQLVCWDRHITKARLTFHSEGINWQSTANETPASIQACILNVSLYSCLARSPGKTHLSDRMRKKSSCPYIAPHNNSTDKYCHESSLELTWRKARRSLQVFWKLIPWNLSGRTF